MADPVSPYLEQERRPIAEVLAARIRLGDTVEHDIFGTGRVAMVLIAAEADCGIAEALVNFASGEVRLVVLRHLTKRSTDPTPGESA
jgi:hypothetical protein